MAENLVEHIEQGDWEAEGPNNESPGNGRFKQPVMVAAAGIGAAVIVMTLPHVYLENIVGASGLSEIVPAAAPPLGTTARGLIAFMACLVSASAIFYFLNRKGDPEMGVALRVNISANRDEQDTGSGKKSRFGLPKFDAKSWTRFLKKPKKDKARIMDLSDLPQLRMITDGSGNETGNEADTSTRASLFAEAPQDTPVPPDGGAPSFEEASADEVNPDEVGFDEVTADAHPFGNMPEDRISAPAMEVPVDEPVMEDELVEETLTDSLATSEASANETLTDDLADLTIAQLADRLEAGLNRLKQLEIGNALAAKAPVQPVVSQPVVPPVNDMPVIETPVTDKPAMPVPPIHHAAEAREAFAGDISDRAENSGARHADMDAALKAALGTLEKMTAQR